MAVSLNCLPVKVIRVKGKTKHNLVLTEMPSNHVPYNEIFQVERAWKELQTRMSTYT